MPYRKRRAAVTAAVLSLLLFVFSGSLTLNAQNQFSFPQPQFVIVANQTSNNVSVFAIDANSGALTQVPGSPFPAGSYPNSVAIDPNGKFAYVVNQTYPYYQGNISAYAINPASGVLTPMGGSPVFDSTGEPYGVAVDPTGKFLYTPGVFTDVVAGYTINPTSGALAQMPGYFWTWAEPEGIAIDPTGKFVYAPNTASDDVSAYTINPTSGALTQIAGSPFPSGGATPSGVENVAFDPEGKFAYVTNVNSGKISAFAIDSASGALSAIPGSPFGDPNGAPYGVTVDPTGRFLYVGNVNNDNVSGFAIDKISGALSPVAGSPFPAGTYAACVVVDHSGRFAYVSNYTSNNISAYTIARDGALTPMAGSPFPAGTQPYGLAITPVSGSQRR
jgi:6-phosphogluconolactonase